MIDGANKLMAMAADGTAPVEIMHTRPAECKSIGRPAWNPVNTHQLALACTSSAGTGSLQLVHLDGTGVVPLDTNLQVVDDLSFSVPVPDPHHQRGRFQARHGPDQKRIEQPGTGVGARRQADRLQEQSAAGRRKGEGRTVGAHRRQAFRRPRHRCSR